MARKTPQQKKRKSYEKDRRNTYGERGSHSRLAVARRKRARRSRQRAAERRATELAVWDPVRAERFEGKEAAQHGDGWRKVPDEPLGKVLAKKLQRRVRSGSVPADIANAKTTRIAEGLGRAGKPKSAA